MTAYKKLAESLNLESDGKPRARRFYAHLKNIEDLLSTGITAKYLVQKLNENGFEINLKTFKEELYRARKKLKKKLNESPKIETASPLSEEAKQQDIEEEHLTEKQRREKLANKYVGGVSNNPLLKKFLREEAKKNATPPESTE
jgi:tRNA A37 threonylcarbamoyltransferase TsaD